MKTFDSKHTAKLFMQICDAIDSQAKRDSFVESVKALYFKKIESEEGEYDEYKVTSQDLEALASNYK